MGFFESGLAPFLEARLNCLFRNLQKYGSTKDEVIIFYSTNPRLIFPYEDYAYLAETLTHLFISDNNLAESWRIPIFYGILEVLKITQYHWENHLNLGISEILNKVETILKIESVKFPKVYPLHSDIYDKHAD